MKPNRIPVAFLAAALGLAAAAIWLFTAPGSDTQVPTRATSSAPPESTPELDGSVESRRSLQVDESSKKRAEPRSGLVATTPILRGSLCPRTTDQAPIGFSISGGLLTREVGPPVGFLTADWRKRPTEFERQVESYVPFEVQVPREGLYSLCVSANGISNSAWLLQRTGQYVKHSLFIARDLRIDVEPRGAFAHIVASLTSKDEQRELPLVCHGDHWSLDQPVFLPLEVQCEATSGSSWRFPCRTSPTRLRLPEATFMRLLILDDLSSHPVSDVVVSVGSHQLIDGAICEDWTYRGTTGSTGEIEVPVGGGFPFSYCMIEARNYSPVVINRREALETLPQDDQQRLVVRLLPSDRPGGTVLDERNLPIAHAQSLLVDPAMFSAVMRGNTQADGSFVLRPGLEFGRVVGAASPPFHGPAFIVIQEQNGTTSCLESAWPSLADGSWIGQLPDHPAVTEVCVVDDATGLPVSSALVRLAPCARPDIITFSPWRLAAARDGVIPVGPLRGAWLAQGVAEGYEASPPRPLPTNGGTITIGLAPSAGQIHVLVVDASAQPVPGAVLWLDGGGRQHEATTDREGRAVMGVQPDQEFRCMVTVPGQVMGSVANPARLTSRREEYVLRVERTERLSFDLRFPDETTPGYAVLVLAPTGNRSGVRYPAWTPFDPTALVTLEPQTIEIAALGAALEQFTWDGLTSPEGIVHVRLRHGPSIRGKLSVSPEHSGPDLEVVLFPESFQVPPTFQQAFRNRCPSLHTPLGKDGSFGLGPLTPGVYEVAVRTDRTCLSLVRVEVSTEDVFVSRELPRTLDCSERP